MYSCDPHIMSFLFKLHAILIGQGYWVTGSLRPSLSLPFKSSRTCRISCPTYYYVSWSFIWATCYLGQGYWKFEGFSFPTIQELVEYQHSSGKPVTRRSGALLKTPISQSRQPKMAEVGTERCIPFINEG